MLLLRGVSLEHSRRALTRTLGYLRQLNATGSHTLATAERFRAVSADGARSLRMLLHGPTAEEDGGGHGTGHGHHGDAKLCGTVRTSRKQQEQCRGGQALSSDSYSRYFRIIAKRMRPCATQPFGT